MHIAQHVHQIADIEAHFQFAALISDFELFARFFLLVVAAQYAEQAGLQLQAGTAEFFVGQNGGALQRPQKLGASNQENFVVIQRNHAIEIGEFPVHHFAHNHRVVAAEAYLIVEQLHRNRLARLIEQLEKLQHGFARQNHFSFGQIGIDGGGRKSQAVAVGGHQAQLIAFHLHQQAVEIIADILHRHAVLHLREHVFKRFLRQRKSGAHVFTDAHQRKIFRRQGLQVEARFACFKREAVLRPIQRHQRAFGQRAQNILQLFGIGGDAEIFGIAVRAVGVDLNFQVGGQDIGLAVHALQQNIAQNRQGVAPLDNAGNGLQGLE